MSSELRVQFAQKAFVVHRDRVLLVRKTSTDPLNPGKWELPGGRLKLGESLDAALIREVEEEAALTVTPGPPLALWSWTLGPGGPTVVAVARLCTVGRVQGVTPREKPADDYIDTAEWFPKLEVEKQDLIDDARAPIASCLERYAALIES